MIRSMTGFGECTRETEQGTVRIEIKSVNHRFFNANVRLPSGTDRLEARVLEWLKGSVQRGHVTLSCNVDRSTATTPPGLPELDLERARAYHAALGQLKETLDLSGEVDLRTLTRVGDLFRTEAGPRGIVLEAEFLEEMVQEALRGLVEQRRAEGARLEIDLRRSLGVLSELTTRVETQAPARLRAERDRLREQIRELTEAVEVDEDRLAREIAYLAERWDVNEEVVRLRSHVALFGESLDGPDDEVAGKRLGFIVQEMNREANTIASKANDPDIQRAAVGMKEEIERIREQVENVE